ncbi:MAG: FKBP-type peptidyl-prolyl cis-trans isomerase, partial [Candidatus Diapherotrites archaeon]|nr:FKBP-type peptidyl-prolyl cis-trans isomerase [Candidatus Diapherotrites archaeon]
PLQFTVGKGHTIKGFEKAVIGMKINQTKKITLQPKEAYGEKDPKKLINIPVSALSHQGIKPEKHVVLSTNIGHGIIVDINDDTVIVDFNHALIGKILKFEITVRTIKTNFYSTIKLR